MQELKHVPGRKTDVKDSDWLAQLLECGWLKASFVPPPVTRELRDERSTEFLSSVGLSGA